MNNLCRLTIAVVGLPFWFVTTGISQETNARWTVPNDPNPQTILLEAEADNRAGRYEDALAKHVWFQENALKIQPAQYGVRLSFALSDWVELGKSYPPALEKLKSIRDEDDRQIREKKASRDLFADFEAINKHVQDPTRTKDTFIWLDKNDATFAGEVFSLAEADLVRAKEYRVCEKYLHPDADFERSSNYYEMQLEIAKSATMGNRLLDFAKKKFSNESATLVALLVVNGRKEQAEAIAAKAEKVLEDSNLKALLEKAKNGEVPEPWP